MIDMLEKTPHPIFVVEGPDGAGKTSLCDKLKEVAGARYIHLTYRHKDKMHLYHGAALRYAVRLAQKQPVIIDRWWPSEIVYADAYRGGSKFAKYYLLFEHIATANGLVYVVCLPDGRERYLEHYNVLKGKRAEMYDEGMHRVYDGYVEMYNHYLGLKENVCRYDMLQNYYEDQASRDVILRQVCQNILEFTEDYRRSF